jgi:hypothetical protein
VKTPRPSYRELQNQLRAHRDQVQWLQEQVESEEAMNRDLEAKLRTLGEILAPYVLDHVRGSGRL